MNTTPERRFDIRTLERNLKKGLITQQQYTEYLANLEDVADKAAKIEAEFVENILSGDSSEDGE